VIIALNSSRIISAFYPLEYSYSDLDEAASEESFMMDENSVKEPTEAEYEKMLLANLSSDESDHEAPKGKRSRLLF